MYSFFFFFFFFGSGDLMRSYLQKQLAQGWAYRVCHKIFHGFESTSCQIRISYDPLFLEKSFRTGPPDSSLVQLPTLYLPADQPFLLCH